MKTTANLALIGYRGVGKTTVARLLALKLGWEWIDADVEIEWRAGKNIAAIFADDGEAAFRDLESQVVADLAQRRDVVLALGGGAVLRPANRQALAATTMIWLKAGVRVIAERLDADARTQDQRPALTAAGGLAEIETLLREREPIYRRCADYSVDTEGKTPQAVADEILGLLGKRDPAGAEENRKRP